jgi:hypothetical protein
MRRLIDLKRNDLDAIVETWRERLEVGVLDEGARHSLFMLMDDPTELARVLDREGLIEE